MTFLQEANLRLEKRLVEAAERQVTQLQHGDKAETKRNEDGNSNGDGHTSSNNNTGNDDDRCAPGDNFWGVINRARGLRSDESNIFGDY